MTNVENRVIRYTLKGDYVQMSLHTDHNILMVLVLVSAYAFVIAATVVLVVAVGVLFFNIPYQFHCIFSPIKQAVRQTDRMK